jgi:hypothetical protein
MLKVSIHAINSITPIDKDTFHARANKKDKTYQEIERQVDKRMQTQIEALET